MHRLAGRLAASSTRKGGHNRCDAKYSRTIRKISLLFLGSDPGPDGCYHYSSTIRRPGTGNFSAYRCRISALNIIWDNKWEAMRRKRKARR
ncbi:g5318 [Coccomyxa elongata]